MAPFFVPGLSEGTLAQRAYDAMRTQIESDTGRRPNATRIMRLWTRRGSSDCVIEVGVRDPLRARTAMAIFDLGSHQPYVVWWQPDEDPEGIREVFPSSAYSVLRFDP